jgi:hypothetical protein
MYVTACRLTRRDCLPMMIEAKVESACGMQVRDGGAL